MTGMKTICRAAILALLLAGAGWTASRADEPPAAVAPEDTPEYWLGLLYDGRADFAAGRYVEAEAKMRKLYEAMLAGVGPNEGLTQLAGTNLGVILTAQGRYAEARAILLAMLRVRIAQLGEDDTETLLTATAYAEALRLDGDFTPALALNRRILQLQEGAGREQEALEAANNLAATLEDMGRTAEAEAMYRRAWTGFSRLSGDDAPYSLTAASNVATTLMALERPGEAEAILRRVWTLRRARLGETHPDTLGAANNLAAALSDMGRADEALAIQRQAWEAMRAALGEDHPATLTAANNYAGMLDPVRDAAECQRLLRHILETRRRLLGEAHPDTLMAANNLGHALHAAGRLAEAEALVAQSAQGYAARLGQGETPPRNLATAYGNLGKMRLGLDRPQGAYEAYGAAAAALRARYADRRATGGSDAARESLEWGRAIFAGQVAAGWRWAHEP